MPVIADGRLDANERTASRVAVRIGSGVHRQWRPAPFRVRGQDAPLSDREGTMDVNEAIYGRRSVRESRQAVDEQTIVG